MRTIVYGKRTAQTIDEFTRQLVMVYKFSCPPPCSQVIMVDANNDDDAVSKIIDAGAINCRNIKNMASCKKVHHLSPLSEKELKEIVRLYMNVENQNGA